MRRLLVLLLEVTAAAWALGCTPSIGDKCTLSTDCSTRGDRLCDTSEPAGYCTGFNCRGDLCPDKAACVLFHASVQGCGYDDRLPSRTGRTFCMAQCLSDSDCRTSDGYVCADPRQAPWSALILDDDQLQRVCIPSPTQGPVSGRPDAAVCQPAGPELSIEDAGASTSIGTGVVDAAGGG
jgi:hypothetical protein